MRRSRRLTHSERVELALFLGLMVIGCIGLTAMFNLNGFPRLFASANGEPVEAAPIFPETPAAEPLPSFLHVPAVPAPEPAPATTPPAPPAQPVNIGNQPSLPPLPSPRTADPAKPKVVKKPVEDVRWYNGKKYKYSKTLKLRVTAYAPDPRCCWPYPGTTTASGLSVKTNKGKLVAADTRLIPMHALVSVPGYNNATPVPVLDRGGAIKGHRLDVLLPTFEIAKEWGSRPLDVKVYLPVKD